ncbi:FxLD family lanthipeptide [Streptomyces sp. NRRL F-5053]|uniref:FxLD family lanthipeptide n=1 Tax=Streptomyces sp. NRRL F-5053 TaxID=1463854 RepID=UPI0004C7D9ED|nr:FxLD family lanthipeptide [Streptomyces sp. NRRL F-5053]
MTTAVLDSVTTPAELPVEDLADDDFQLDVRVVVSHSPVYNFNCPTSDGCGNTCANGASSCASTIEDAA